MERETGVEPATSTLARSRSTTELLPLNPPIINHAFTSGNAGSETLVQSKHSGNQISLAVHTRSAHSPLRIFFRRYDAAIPHMNDAVSIFCGLGIVRDHQNGLP
jgi:hypothetical protein